MNKKQTQVVRVAVLVLTARFCLFSYLHHFLPFYHSRPSDLPGLVFTILFFAFYILSIVCLKQIKAARWLFLGLSFLSVVSAAAMWSIYFIGTNPAAAVLTFLVVIVITPFYGLTFCFGSEGLLSLPFLTVLSVMVVLLLLLKLFLFTHSKKDKFI